MWSRSRRWCGHAAHAVVRWCGHAIVQLYDSSYVSVDRDLGGDDRASITYEQKAGSMETHILVDDCTMLPSIILLKYVIDIYAYIKNLLILSIKYFI